MHWTIIRRLEVIIPCCLMSSCDGHTGIAAIPTCSVRHVSDWVGLLSEWIQTQVGVLPSKIKTLQNTMQQLVNYSYADARKNNPTGGQRMLFRPFPKIWRTHHVSCKWANSQRIYEKIVYIYILQLQRGESGDAGVVALFLLNASKLRTKKCFFCVCVCKWNVSRCFPFLLLSFFWWCTKSKVFKKKVSVQQENKWQQWGGQPPLCCEETELLESFLDFLSHRYALDVDGSP